MSMRYTQLTADAVDRVLDDWAIHGAGAGVAALLPEAEKDRLPMLQAACRQRGLALVGGIFPALVRDGGFVSDGAWLFFFERMPPHALLPVLDPAGPLVERIVAAIREGLRSYAAEADKPTLFLCFDGMVPNIASVLDGVYLEIANRVEYSGVNAGSETFQPMACLFDAHRVIGNAVSILLLPAAFAPVLAHGFRCPQRTMCATSTDGNRIAMIDWRPAFEVYQEIVRSEYGIELTRDNFYEYAVHFPFGILRAGGDVVVRIPVGLSEDGSLHCVGEIPEHAMLVLLRAPSVLDGDCVGRLGAGLKSGAGFQAGDRLLTFYCAGRRMHLGSDASRELGALQAATGASEMAGALSLGEIGSTVRHAYPMFHNAALLCAAWERS